MTIAQVLTAADARLTPETWTQRMSPESYRAGKRCAYWVIDEVAPSMRTRNAAIALFAQLVSGTPEIGNIWLWNDRASTTLADVHTAFAAAVEIARQQEQSVREEVPCAG